MKKENITFFALCSAFNDSFAFIIHATNHHSESAEVAAERNLANVVASLQLWGENMKWTHEQGR